MTRPHFKVLWIETRQTIELAFPIVASQVGQLLLGIVDTLMIAQLGVVPLGASAFATSLFSLFLVFGFGVMSCVSPLVARADGAQKFRECGEILKHGLVFATIFGLALALVIQILAHRIEWFRQPPEIAESARSYLAIMGWSILPAVLWHTVRQFTEGLHRPGFPMFLTFGGVLLNAGLNYILIWGHFGFPAMGLDGAAWATFFVRVFMFGALAVYIFRSIHFAENLPLKWLTEFRRTRFYEMFSLGFPTALQTLFEVGAFCVAAVMMGWLGAKALAAHQIAINVVSITFMVILGLSFAVSIRTGHALGREDRAAARRLGFGAIGLSSVIMFYFAILILILNEVVPLLYVSDPDVIGLASQLLIIGGLFQVFDGVQGVAAGALRGLHDVKLPTFVGFVSYWLVSIPLFFYLGFERKMGGAGIWLGLLMGLAVASIALTWRFHRITRLRPSEEPKFSTQRKQNA